MKVLMNTGGIAMTNCFLVADEEARQAVLFDAPNDTTRSLLDEAERKGWDVVGLWLTHGHFDHFWDHAYVKQRCPSARILIHRLDVDKVRNPSIQLQMFGLPSTIPSCEPDEVIEDGQKLRLGSLEFAVMHTPGHAIGHVCYYCSADGGILIGGDLIIGGSVGRTDLPDSDHGNLERSIRRVMELPKATRLLPGHGEPATLEDELQTNPYVQDAIANQG